MFFLYLLIKLVFSLVPLLLLTQFKYSLRRSYIIIGVSQAIILIAGYLIYLLKGANFLGYVLPIILTLPSVIVFALLSKHNFPKVLFTFFTVITLTSFKSFIGFLSLNISNSPYTRLIIETIVFAITILYLVKYLRKPYLKLFNTIDKGWLILCLVPFFIYAITYFINYSPLTIRGTPISVYLTLLVYTLSFVFYAVLYINFENITRFFRSQQDEKIMLIQSQMQKKEYQALIENLHTNKIFRHDIKYHFETIDNFLSDNNIAEAQKYVRKLTGKLEKTVIEKYCDNYDMNVILSSYIKKAQQEHIEVFSEIHIPENIKIDTIDLNAIFANAIDNAINACNKIADPNDRKITIVCKEHFDQIYIRISNSYVGEMQFDGEYPVSNGIDHGIGTKSIAAIAEKHGGVFSFAAQDGIFKTTVTLKY